MLDRARGSFWIMHIHLLNGRLFQRLLSRQPGAEYRSEQGKILSALWEREGRRTVTDISLQSGLANNTLTSMLRRMQDQGLVRLEEHPIDKRKKIVCLTDKGWSQKAIGDRVSRELADIFYGGFSPDEISAFEAYLERILANLSRGMQASEP